VTVWTESRWSCPKCGRFLPDSALRSWDVLNPDAYYGVSGHTEATCGRCGVVSEPNLVTIRAMPVCPAKTPEPHLLGEFPMTCYSCHVEADS
jgi:ribosomal protein S27AE